MDNAGIHRYRMVGKIKESYGQSSALDLEKTSEYQTVTTKSISEK